MSGYFLCTSAVRSPPSSRIRFSFLPSLKASSCCSRHQLYSSSVSPFHANTGTPAAAMAAAAWSCVEKMLQLDHVTCGAQQRGGISRMGRSYLGAQGCQGFYQHGSLNGYRGLSAHRVMPEHVRTHSYASTLLSGPPSMAGLRGTSSASASGRASHSRTARSPGDRKPPGTNCVQSASFSPSLVGRLPTMSATLYFVAGAEPMIARVCRVGQA